MARHSCLRLTLAVALTLVPGGRAHAQDRLRSAADSFFVLSRPNDALVFPDLSDSTRQNSERRLDRVATQVQQVAESQLASPNDRLLYDNLREVVAGQIGSRACRFHLWATPSQFFGWHVAASDWARTQKTADAAARTRALDVLHQIPHAIAEERALLQRGLDSGYTSPRAVIAAVVAQYEDLLPSDVAASPLFAPVRTDPDTAFSAKWRVYLTDTVYPAAKQYRDFLEKEYLPRARPDGSLSLLPNGVACYKATLRAQTSVPINLDSLMLQARARVRSYSEQLAPLVQRLTGASNVSVGVQQLRADARFTFPSRDSVLDAYRAMTTRAARQIGTVVAGFSPESVVVLPYPEFQEKAGLPPQYQQASEDGTRPAQFLVNLSRTERMSVANAVAHEAYPGHHLQHIAELRAPVVHPAMRTLFVVSFAEGWGIYAEQLAEPMGLYDSDLARVGFLVHQLDVAVAAYLDAGFHGRGWTRAMLVDTMMALGGRPRPMAEAYADRHAATPGQLATYYVGVNAIRASRNYAERMLGDRFNLAEFDREVIRHGSITLASMAVNIERWVKEQGAVRGGTP